MGQKSLSASSSSRALRTKTPALEARAARALLFLGVDDRHGHEALDV
jgi:hypothetical protein